MPPSTTDPALGTCSDDDLDRLAACTLLIGAPIDKNKQRILDGKIENLWLKDEGTRLDTVRMLSTLLLYVRDFCGGIEVPHISSIQKLDHPAWLREFFAISGFNRCECLKPEAGNQRYRACYQLGGPIQKAVQGNGLTKSTNEVKGKNENRVLEGKIEAKKNEEVKANGAERSISRKVPTPPTSTGLTIAALSSPQQQKRSEDPCQVNEIISKQRSGDNLSKAATTAHEVQSPKVTESQDKMVNADEWLSQNQKILSSKGASPATISADHPKKGLVKVAQKPPAGNGKRDADTAGLNGTEASDRNTKQRREHADGEGEPNIRQGPHDDGLPAKPPTTFKQGPHDDGLPARPTTTSKETSQPTAKYSFTMTAKTQTPSSTREGRSGDRSITDALLEQVDRSTAKPIPEQVMKESKSSRYPSWSPPERRRQRSVDFPSAQLTCYYWKHQGGCSKPDWLCQYAHWDTGHDASAPNSYRYKSKKQYSSYYGQSDGGEDPYTDLPYTEESRKTAKDLKAPTGPRADAEGVPQSGMQIKRIDSYRPES